ncbi:MAG TPA: hypothetical protein PKM63_14780 [Panacibacter sp.]|nr:hypothetical protein [Panacibacter sp.]HNP45553.1 hypothetical protein [Panacibacter sp.]
MSKYLLFFLAFIFFLSEADAQQPEDALKFSWYLPGGTARFNSIGGAVGSLGGDITANNVNPAGIGLYKTGEVILTPGMLFNNTKSTYLGSDDALKKNGFAYGATGFVLGSTSRYNGPMVSSAFSISVNQLASFNNHTYYKGSNNYSSYSEKYLEELIRDNASPYAAENNYIFGSSLAYRTYLIDSTNSNGQLIGYKSLVPIGTGVSQERDEDTKGGIHEIALAWAGNFADKLFLGVGLNIPVVDYTRDLSYKETDLTTNPDNNFDFFEYKENYRTSGAGINAKLGFIYKLQDKFRLGFAFHTPTLLDLKDKIRSSMTTNTEAYAGLLSETSDNLNSGNAGEVHYNLVTPYRLLGSFSFVFGSVADTKKQKGFITADVEYVNYRGARYSTAAENSDDQTANDYYNAMNDVIKDYYKGNFNFKLGGELKFDPIAVRLGGAYYGSPYADKSLKASRFLLTGGLGYRKHGYFLDLAYGYSMNKDVNFPYRLNDKANVFANQQNNRGNLVFTLGIKI